MTRSVLAVLAIAACGRAPASAPVELSIRVTTRAEQSPSELRISLEIRPDYETGMDMISYPGAVTEKLVVRAGGSARPVLSESFVPRVWGGEITLTLAPVVHAREVEVDGVVRIRYPNGSFGEWTELRARKPITAKQD